MEASASRLHATNVALLWWNVGVGWLLYFDVYRIHAEMTALGDAALQAFSRGYSSRLPIVVLPYGAICLLAVLELWSEPARNSRCALWGMATRLELTILSTPFAAGARGDMQEPEFTEQAYQHLQMAHLVLGVLTTISAVCGIVAA